MVYSAGSSSLVGHQPPQSQISGYDSKFEDEAFEIAFAEAESAVSTTTTERTAERTGEGLLETGKESQGEGGEREEQFDGRGEGDKLAETAGELFDRLQYERERDEKFRNSRFMALMRKLRDREVVVEGNEMVETVREGEKLINGINGIEGEEGVVI
jgi:hypothetical protein